MSSSLYATRFGATALAASTTTTVGQIALSALWAAAGKSGAGYVFLDCAYGATCDSSYYRYGRIVANLNFDGVSTYSILEQSDSPAIYGSGTISAVAFDISGTNLRFRVTEGGGQSGFQVLGIMSVMAWT